MLAITPEEASDRLYLLDAEMRAHYAEALEKSAASLSPVIHAQFDEDGGTYHLRRNGRLLSVQPTPKQYKRLKSISHTPLAIYTILVGHEDWQQSLQSFCDHMQAGLDTLDRTQLPPELVEGSRAILAEGVAFCREVLAAGTYDIEQYHQFAHKVAPYLRPNIEAAAAMQVDAFEALVKTWRAEMGEEEWGRLMVVVTTAWAMRRDNVHFQIFAHLMGHDAVHQRLILAEGFNDTPQAFDLLGRIVMDRQVSKLVFEDPLALDVELMGEGALKRIEDYACPVYPSIKGPKKPLLNTEIP